MLWSKLRLAFLCLPNVQFSFVVSSIFFLPASQQAVNYIFYREHNIINYDGYCKLDLLSFQNHINMNNQSSYVAPKTG